MSTKNLTVYVAIDERGDGWVLAHEGNDTPDRPNTLSVHDCWSEEISAMSRLTDELPFDKRQGWPDAPGLWKWEGVFGYHRSYSYEMDDAEPYMNGAWTAIHRLALPAPTEAP